MTAGTMAGTFGRLGSRIGDGVLLRAAERTARGYSPAQQRAIQSLHEAAARRIDGAVEMSDPRSAPAVTLLREAALLLVRAILEARRAGDGAEHLDAARAWSRIDEVVASGDLPAPPDEVARARPVLGSADPLAFDALGDRDAAAVRAAADATVAWLRARVEARSVAEIRRARVGRLVTVGLIVACLAAWGVWRLAGATNLALGKPATASSRWPGTPAADAVCNGTVEPSYGVHTTVEENPWVKIDLGAVRSVGRVKVYNRGDGFFDEGLPLVLDLSEDEQTWTEVDRRTVGFTQAAPWVADAGGRRARFVRVRSPKKGYFALSEIEVYGRK